MIMHGQIERLRRAVRRLSTGRAGVALMFAILAPALLAITGAAVDIGYWYQNQTTLQSAADAAALAAAMNDSRLNQSTASTKATAAAPYAQLAADNATGKQFNFAANSSNTNPQISVTCCASAGSAVGSYVLTTAYKASVSAPRTDFFSPVGGGGWHGLASGTQSASATATITKTMQVTGDSCLLANPGNSTASAIAVDENGNNSLTGVNCNFTSNCPTASDTGFKANGSAGSITAETITVAGANCGTPISGTTSNIYTTGNQGAKTGISTVSSAVADPFASMGDPPTAWESLTTPTCTIQNGTTYTVPAGPCVVTIPNGNGAMPTNLIFTGGTYYFPNTQLKINGGSVTFGPGIYYFSGNGGNNSGGLTINGNATISANGATFVFVSDSSGATDSNPQPGASYSFGGGSGSTTLHAPTSNCVSPSSYPESTYSSAAPYDGTNGEGICGILIYEARNDSSGGSLAGSSTSTDVEGVIYTPAAAFSANGGATISSASSSATFAILARTVTVSGNTSVNLSLGSDSVGTMLSGTTTTVVSTSPPILTN